MAGLPFRTAPTYAEYGNADSAKTYGGLVSGNHIELQGAVSNLLKLPSTASNGTILAVHTTQTMTHSIRVKDSAGNSYFLMATNAATNRGGGA
jgi:hypothetical protein